MERMEALRAEEERHRKLQTSCKSNKVRTYACDEDGYRIVKYFSYKYDFKADQCVELVKKRTVKCESGESEFNNYHDSYER